VLQGIHLQVGKGQNVVVMGRSGTGKSVLIKIVCGLLKADEGQVQVLGRDLSTLTSLQLLALRLKVGFSFQGSALYDSMTVRENLEFPLLRQAGAFTRKEINVLVEGILEAIGLSETINQLPAELSGGQKKRIGIGRTLILRPQVMLYDEPTAGLDPISSNEINHLINRVKDDFQVSSILITHDLTCAKCTGDRVAMLLEGQVAKEGVFADVFNTDDPRIQDFYNYNFTH
jgi:phospholipid/cholesterol/gamma-HCH transport system ATP-binding protein